MKRAPACSKNPESSRSKREAVDPVCREVVFLWMNAGILDFLEKNDAKDENTRGKKQDR